VANPVTPNTPPAEFVQLANTYLDRLQAYRAQLVEHRLGKADCSQLTGDMVSVAEAHAPLARYVEGRPDLADRFAVMHAEYVLARQRFETSGCEIPPELVDTPPAN